MHFVRPMPFLRIVPPYFPHALTLVRYGYRRDYRRKRIIVPRSRRLAAGGFIVVLVAVYPANGAAHQTTSTERNERNGPPERDNDGDEKRR